MAFRQVLFLGAPGVGKGTYAKRAAPLLQFCHLSPGDLLRKLAPMDPSVSAYLDKGHLVPESVVFKLVGQELTRLHSSFKGVILDGFPRSVEQARGWIADHQQPLPDLVVEFHLPEHLLIEKLLGRRICSQCGDLYNIYSFNEGEYSMPAMMPEHPGVCDKCGGGLIQRSDDRIDIIKERLRDHWMRETPLVDYLRSKAADNVVRFDVKSGIAQLGDLVTLIKRRLNSL